MSKLQEILGLSKYDLFTVLGHNNVYQLVDNDHIKTLIETSAQWIDGDYILPEIINNTGIISKCTGVTRPQYSQIQHLYDLGFRFLCKNRDGKVFAYTHIPSRDHEEWLHFSIARDLGQDSVAGGTVLNALACLIPNWHRAVLLDVLLAKAKVLETLGEG